VVSQCVNKWLRSLSDLCFLCESEVSIERQESASDCIDQRAKHRMAPIGWPNG
jgi:hypothetical protein